jgi:hypothetical protein
VALADGPRHLLTEASGHRLYVDSDEFDVARFEYLVSSPQVNRLRCRPSCARLRPCRGASVEIAGKLNRLTDPDRI